MWVYGGNFLLGIFKPRSEGRRIPIWGIALIFVGSTYLGPPVFARVEELWRVIPYLPQVTFGMVFLGVFVAGVLSVFEEKGKPRRIPVWAVVVISVVTGLGLPRLIDKVSGKYQHLSLRSDVNHCTLGMRGKVAPHQVSNVCDFPITVGLCMSSERNPAPCKQALTVPPGGRASFDPGDETLSYAGNRSGLTFVACRPPHRPSREMNQTGKNYEGICLPGL